MTESVRTQIATADAMLRESQERLSAFGGLHEKLRELVGRAEFDEGKIVAEWSAADGLTVLDLDARVMRMPSADLATAIRETIGNAVADLRGRTRQAVAESGAMTTASASPEKVAEQLREKLETARAQFSDAGRAAADGLERAQQRLDQGRR